MKLKINGLNRKFFLTIKYKKFLELPLEEKSVLLESTHGMTYNGNMYYIVKELCTNTEFNNYNTCLVVDSKIIEKTKKIIERNHWKKVNIIEFESEEYFKKLATAKYLINDTTFMPYFIKRDNQIYLNTWHGTPLKYLGKSVKNECHTIGNIQRNFLFANYLLYPNEYTRDIMLKDYMINNLKSNGKIILNGYPRNTIFFDIDNIKKIKNELHIEDKKIICYLPTWRGLVADKENHKALYDMKYYLEKIDKEIKDNQIFYVNLHPYFKGKIDFSIYNNIKEFPSKYETYEFLSVADVLVTDYSSVFFDFAITKKPIVLFTYDEEEYLEERGTYFSIKDLPFSVAKTVKQLFDLIENEKNYDETEFLKKFCTYDNKDATKQILEIMLLNKNTNNIQVNDIENNGKKNVLIYSGNLAKNGITTSLKNLLNSVDTEKYNFFITFRTNKVAEYKDELFSLPENVNYIAMQGRMNLKLSEKFKILLYTMKKMPFNKFISVYEKNTELELKRLFGNAKFDNVIQFSGYDYKLILLFSFFKCNTSIYVHNNMMGEMSLKGNQRFDVLKYAYNKYKNVVLVTEDMRTPTKEIKGDDQNFVVVNNIIDKDRVIRLSKETIKLDATTQINVSLEKLEEILNDKSLKKFINIGRFSKEKGHIRLIKAFNNLYQNNKDAYLIIIGGYGDIHDEILEYAKSVEVSKQIIIIKSISNPFPILKKCNYFILSSLHEGFGLVLAEADILGLPCVSTEILGPTTFMKEYNGKLVENSLEGVQEGLELLYNNKVKQMNIDYDNYNKNAINQFYNLLKETE